jgi:hypothetical protein
MDNVQAESTVMILPIFPKFVKPSMFSEWKLQRGICSYTLIKFLNVLTYQGFKYHKYQSQGL